MAVAESLHTSVLLKIAVVWCVGAVGGLGVNSQYHTLSKKVLVCTVQ